MKSENEIPGLRPFDDRNPYPERLFRKPSEMTDDQFALLAAAWAEGALDEESLLEIESIFNASPEKRVYAEGFRKLRLQPGTEKWNKRNSLLRTSPFTVIIRLGAITTLAAAAVLTAVIMIKPLVIDTGVNSSAPIELRIASATPLFKMKYYPSARQNNDHVQPVAERVAFYEKEIVPVDAQTIEPIAMSTLPVTLPANSQTAILALGPVPVVIASDATTEITTSDENWLVRGLTAIAGLVSKDKKTVDGYMIAGACIKGVNSLLGWDMQLERKMTEAGDPLSVNFTSTLVSFNTPVKKNLPVQ